MRFPRYRLRTLLIGITVFGLLMGCVFGGWAEFLLIALSLRPGETVVYEQTIEVAPGRRERLVQGYTLDPASFLLEVVQEDGERQEVLVEGNGTGVLGLRWVELTMVSRNGQLQVLDADTGRVMACRDSPDLANWPAPERGRVQTVGGRGLAFNIGPEIWLYTTKGPQGR
jgi:hypothetical protein